MCCNIPGPDLDPTDFEDTISGCLCRDSCGAEATVGITSTQSGQTQACTCLKMFGQVYDKMGCLTPLSRDNPSALPILTECNSRCSCPPTCNNRVIQKGIRYKLEVFSHAHKGLSLRSLELIKELTFICEYAGEVLPAEEAKRRSQQQTDKDMNYIFVLKEHFASGLLMSFIDPCKRGNIGRFLNHSCEPNAFIVPIRVENMVPRLCVFALSDILPGMEITYDYGSDISGDNTCDEKGSDSEELLKISRQACHCMSSACKGFLPFDGGILK